MSPSRTSRRSPSEPPHRFFHRDISWLEFNRRVLAQAADPAMPLLERVRFLAIFTSNLDEFFMKRVGLIKRQVHAGLDARSPDGLSPRQQLAAIREMVGELIAEQGRVFDSEIRPSLRKEGIEVLHYADLTRDEQDATSEWYIDNVFPALTPLAVNPTHRFPFISNLSDNLGVLVDVPEGHASQPARAQSLLQPTLGADAGAEPTFARVKIPATMPHYYRLPAHDRRVFRFVPLQQVIRHNLAGLFPGMRISEQISFRVTRSAGIQKDDLDTANLLQSIEADLKARKFARAVRLEIQQSAEPRLLRWLLDKLNVDPQDVYERPGDIDFAAMGELADVDRPDLRHKPWKPVIPGRLIAGGAADRNPANFFAALRKQDVLVHHPYESFHASVERFIASAAADPDVLTIKQTLYRTTPDSPFIENLVRAAEAGKQVACLVELRARFDEGRNVRFARQLEKAGVHVAYGVLGLKTHCKTSLVVRREKGGLRCYAHLGTGNYHPKTAQLYTDVGLLTCDPDITGDLVHLFNFLTGVGEAPSCSTLLVAPFTMRDRTLKMIAREAENAKKGLPARIWGKLNAMEDREVTEHLYAASQAGVKVDLVVRGFCCLRPGVPGLSENIRVSSVVGRFLEHSRIYHFANGEVDPADGDWYISSADWMYRNLSNRVEVSCPVRDSDARRRLQRIFEVHHKDRVNAWDLTSAGAYARRTPPPDADPSSPEALGTFEALMREPMG
ncbi:MAG: polyphosphate kinase 1 [Phycisphaerales bacterium]